MSNTVIRAIALIIALTIAVGVVFIPSAITSHANPAVAPMVAQNADALLKAFIGAILAGAVGEAVSQTDLDIVLENIQIGQDSMIELKPSFISQSTGAQRIIFERLKGAWAETVVKQGSVTDNAFKNGLITTTVINGMPEMKFKKDFLALLTMAVGERLFWFSNKAVEKVEKVENGYAALITHGRSVTFGAYTYQSIKGVTNWFLVNRAVSSSNTQNGDTFRLVPYFSHNGEIYISSARPVSDSSFALGFYPVFLNSDNPTRYYMNFRDLVNSGTLLNSRSYLVVREVNTAMMYTGFDWEYNLREGEFVLRYMPIYSQIGYRELAYHNISTGFRIYLPNHFIKVSTGEHVDWRDVWVEDIGNDVLPNIPDMHLMVTRTAEDGTTIEDVIKGKVPGVDNLGFDVISLPKPWLEDIIDKAIDKGLVSTDPDIAINSAGDILVDGTNIKDLEKALEGTKTDTLDLAFVLPDAGSWKSDFNMNMVIDRFPFSLPWDLQYVMGMLRVQPKPPIFTYNIRLGQQGSWFYIDREMTIDPTIFRGKSGVDMIQVFIRFISVILVVIALIKATLRIMPI
jgi:hypothetical protein